ncbi:MAG: hypothetical protein IT384_32970 [Deltaproteobacteria bacterium]|nr:hypothetical protein [Deltaproteobacteria bacterium]
MHLAKWHGMVLARVTPPSPPRPFDPGARRARRERATARVAQAVERTPDLRIDRLTPFVEVLRQYRLLLLAGAPIPTPSPLVTYLAIVEGEVASLEARASALPRSAHKDGATIRRALCFLRTFGRISALDFELVPTEERSFLVQLLRLEYRWCFAAAGTTMRVFKIAIGRTGAR